MKTSKEILTLVNDYLGSLPYDRQPQSLYDPIRYTLDLGGKRIRPVLMLLAYNLYREDPERILSQACALETYHNFTLLHDDLMDNAAVRRGKPTVHKKWDANTAILSGDAMLSVAFKRMMQNCPDDSLRSVMELFTETTLLIDEGQQMDMEFETRNDVTEDEYIEMIRLKTSVLLACALKMGALLANADERDAQTLYDFGVAQGLAFQLQDDYLDVYGDPAVFGKAIGGDILCNKKTYMLINALRLADDSQRRQLEQWLQTEPAHPQEKIAAVTDLYNKIGVDQLASQKIQHYFAIALQLLQTLNVPEQRKAELASYTHAMMSRQK
ncbi:MAG: polyprenyl synthetase family protein [Prevotella sp.]|jgi:geranylgeranyl diphosphate synthase type II|nr:polyprenyl synthetase family protein [Prevotella sp.]